MKFLRLIFFTMLCAGCAHFQSRPLVPEKTAAQWESRRLDDGGLKRFLEENLSAKIGAWPRTNWDLNALTLVAFYFHPGLEVARDNWLLADAGVETAGARPNPSVSVVPSFDSQIPGNYSPWLVSAAFDLPIETMGKRAKRMAEAQKNAESARWQFVSVAWHIRSGVRAGLRELKFSSQRQQLLRQQLLLQQEIAGSLRQRWAAGEISQPELTTADIALNRVQLDLNDAESLAISARSHLAEALGLPQAALADAAFDLPVASDEADKLTSLQARKIALRSRADILAALADYAAAEDELQLQVAKQFPDLHLGPGYAWNSGNAGDNQWSLGATLELPILDQNQGPIAEAEARRKLMAAKLIELQAGIIGQIDRALADFHTASQQLKVGNALLAASHESERSWRLQFAAGAVERLDYLNESLAAGSAALAQLDLEEKFQTAIGELEDAIQIPNDAFAAALQTISADTAKADPIHP